MLQINEGARFGAGVVLERVERESIRVDHHVTEPRAGRFEVEGVQDAETWMVTWALNAPTATDAPTTTASAKAKWGSPVMGSLGTLPLVISAKVYE